MRAWTVSWRTAVLCCLGSFCLLWGAASASAHIHYTFTGSFGAVGSGAGQLSLTAESGVAANSETHDIYVADTGNNRVDEFEANGAFVRAWGWGVATGAAEAQTCTVSCEKGLSGSAPGEFAAPAYVAVDNSSGGAGDVYVADVGQLGESSLNFVSKFDSGGKLIETWGVKGRLDGSSAPEGPFGRIVGIDVDMSGSLWVSALFGAKAKGNSLMYEFSQGGSFTQSWEPPFADIPESIAVDGSDNLYFISADKVLRASSSGSPIGRSYNGETIEGALTSGPGITGIAADPATNNIYVEAGGSIERFASSCKTVGELTEGCTPLESFGLPRSVGGADLAVDSGTGTVYVVKPGSDVVEAFTPEVPQPPTVEDESVSAVTSGSTTLSAKIDPDGPEAFYHVEYGPTASYGETVPVPDGVVGSGFEGQEVSVHVQDLQEHTTYHFRVVTHNSLGTIYGEDQTFVTEANGSALGLPDGRLWEMVTPAQKDGALFFGQSHGILVFGAIDPFVAEASAGGDAMIDMASQPTEAEPQGYTNEVSVLSTRGPEGWSSQVIAPPHNEGTGPAVGFGGEYNFFSEDLAHSVLVPFGNFDALSPETTEATPYLRTDYLNGDVTQHCQASCYRPMVTAANTRTGAVFGEEAEEGICKHFKCGPEFVDATSDASHIVISSPEQLTSSANESADEKRPGSGSERLYEWSGGQLQPLYLLPESEGGTGVYAGKLSPVTHNMSRDGSIFFSYGGHLYLHDFAKDDAVRLDLAQGVEEPSEGGASFLYAGSDGSSVLFSDAQRLTKASGGGVYECRVVEVAGKVTCELELTGLSPGTLIGGSNDASYLYFMGAGKRLSVDHYGGKGWTTTEGPFIGTQPVSPASVGETEDSQVYRVSPNGRYLTFMSNEDLTGYGTRDALSGHLDQEVYLYDAGSNRLVCASCNPTGARPVGVEYEEYGLVGGSLSIAALSHDPWEASNLPPWTRSNARESVYQPRFLSDSGRLFFDSNDALVPQDVNGTQDVYEYELAGVGSCSASSLTYSERSGGCVSLISSGTSPEESAFMDASETGGDVFFITLSKLVPQDFDKALDVYDAHECSDGVPCFAIPPVPPPVCSTGDACKPSASPQPSIFGAAPSATFSGAGNVVPLETKPLVKQKSLTRAQKLAHRLKACRKKAHKRRTSCERQARKRYGSVARKSGRAISQRKGGR